MSRSPDWTDQEFRQLLSHSDLSPPELAARLPGRTAGAIEWVRQGVHEYHRGGDNKILSLALRQVLQDSDMTLHCRVCGELLREA